MTRYPHLFSPVQIGRLHLHNRIFVPAHTTNLGEDGLPTDRHAAYHAARARGGAALIIFEGIRVHPTSVARTSVVNGYDPRCVGGFRRVVEAVHAHGAALFGQLLHLGRQAEGHLGRTATWSASPIPWSPAAATPHAMTRDDIREVIAAYVQTARHLQEAGVDGVEVHLGHGHLPQQFLSPASNHRTDEYGGGEENRLRFSIELVRAVRQAMGPDYVVGIRISADEFLPGGLTLDDMRRIVPRIAGAVPLHFINVSHSAYHASYSLATQIADMHFPPAPFRHFPAAIKAAVPHLPILAACRLNVPDIAESMLADGGADMIGLARAHIADPSYVMKLREDRQDDIRPCIACNQGCIGMIELHLPITCLMNPTAGREQDWDAEALERVGRPRRVLVIGGGPAGLEAARVAASRGHHVTLWERSAELGGQVNIAARITARAEFTNVRAFLEAGCRKTGVRIECGTEATVDRVRAFQPDALIVATGATPRRAAFPGGDRALTVWEALEHPGRLGDHVAFIEADGSWPSVATAEHLADLGKRVTLVTAQGTYGWGITTYSLLAVRQRFRDKRIRVLPLRVVRNFDGRRLVLDDLSTGADEILDGVDGVVAAVGGHACDRLARDLRPNFENVYTVGDCVAPRTALEAIYEGHAAGRTI